MITVDRDSSTPIYQQVFDGCREGILAGDYPAQSRLPAIRTLAKELGVSRNTVEAVYRQLVQEGYVTNRPGSGFYVETLDLDPVVWADPLGVGEREGAEAAGLDAQAAPAITGADAPIRYDFTYGDLSDDAFPATLWRKLTGEVLLGPDAVKANRYDDPQGEPELRADIARQAAASRGVRCTPDQVVVLPGTQIALQCLLQLFDPADCAIAMENPGYDGARATFECMRFPVVPLGVSSASGWDVDALARSGARLAFVTPSSQFPIGIAMPLATRQKLLAWARATDSFIIEDDFCREFRYDTHPLPSLQSLDAAGRVVYMGTLSKALSPALRMNYLILPPELLARWRTVFAGQRCAVPWLSQAVLHAFIEEGHWDRLLRRAQTRNKRKHAALLGAVKRHLDGHVHVVENGVGLHILMGTRDERTQEELIESAAAAGVRVYRTHQYWMQPSPAYADHVLVGFSRIPEEDIDPGIEALARAWFSKDAARFVDSLSEHRESRFDTMSKAEIRAERLRTRGLM